MHCLIRLSPDSYFGYPTNIIYSSLCQLQAINDVYKHKTNKIEWGYEKIVNMLFRLSEFEIWHFASIKIYSCLKNGTVKI